MVTHFTLHVHGEIAQDLRTLALDSGVPLGVA